MPTLNQRAAPKPTKPAARISAQQHEHDDVHRAGDRRPEAVVDGGHEQDDDQAEQGIDHLARHELGQVLVPGDGRADHGDAGDRQDGDRRQKPDVEVTPDASGNLHA